MSVSHLIGGLSAALTGALRALLDSAHITTAPTMLKLKGAKMSGQSLTIEPTQVSEIEGAPGIDDIRKIAMPLPFNQPSPVLLELLGWLSNAAKGVVTTSEEKIADITSKYLLFNLQFTLSLYHNININNTKHHNACLIKLCISN